MRYPGKYLETGQSSSNVRKRTGLTEKEPAILRANTEPKPTCAGSVRLRPGNRRALAHLT